MSLKPLKERKGEVKIEMKCVMRVLAGLRILFRVPGPHPASGPGAPTLAADAPNQSLLLLPFQKLQALDLLGLQPPTGLPPEHPQGPATLSPGVLLPRGGDRLPEAQLSGAFVS